MGSKRWMLSNGLGNVLADASSRATRVVDLFTGSGSVAIHVATKFPVRVDAFDLQKFSACLALSVLGRTAPVDASGMLDRWFSRAQEWRKSRVSWRASNPITKASVMKARSWSEKQVDAVVTRAYGGHYFSPDQALWIDALRNTLPSRAETKSLALAALVDASSKCAASPGHTAQPFQPTDTALRFVNDAWQRDVLSYVAKAAKIRSVQYANVLGSARVEDCLSATKDAKRGDLFFIDPPYSGVHYSRFYHVLETVVSGRCGEVSGVGRYPATKYRPISAFSMKTTSIDAMRNLLSNIARGDSSAIITFPDHECSNGLSGEAIREIARECFKVKEKLVESKFSTLGGTSSSARAGNNRAARVQAKELILSLGPRA